jgi:hypothetical protein
VTRRVHMSDETNSIAIVPAAKLLGVIWSSLTGN